MGGSAGFAKTSRSSVGPNQARESLEYGPLFDCAGRADLRRGALGGRRIGPAICTRSSRCAFSTLQFLLTTTPPRNTARLIAHLATIGQVIGPNDLFIAAIALANQLTLVTHNTAEFSRVRGLSIEDWQIP